VDAYTVTFPKEYLIGESNFDDAAIAARTARRFGARYHEIEIRPQVADLLPKLLWHMDEPVADPAIITAYSVCREARKSSTVLLGGVGGDEIFGGYRKYQASVAAKAYRRLPAFLRRGLIEPALARIPPLSGTPLKGRARWARKFAASASLSPREQFVADATYLDAGQRRALSPRLYGAAVSARHDEAFSEASHADWLNQLLYVDSQVFMPSLNLNYNDKMGMAASLEVRVPFLDHQFADWVAWNVSPGLKLRGMTTKHILRRAMTGVVPDEVLRQPKASFGAPVGHWLENELREMTDELLSERRLKERGWLEPKLVRRMVEEHRSRRRDHGMQLWQFLTLELWASQFLDRKRAGVTA
jgi:asparagine synthase (glutamine-hydrolysing)